MILDVTDIPHNKLKNIPTSHYKDNRENTLKILREKLSEHAYFTGKGVIFVKGHTQYFNNNDEDCTSNWRPEPNFLYLFGFKDVFGLHGLIDIETGEAIVAVPRQPEEDKIFHTGLSVDSDTSKFGIDKFMYNDELETYLSEKKPEVICLYDGRNRFDVDTHKPRFEWLSKHK